MTEGLGEPADRFPASQRDRDDEPGGGLVGMDLRKDAKVKAGTHRHVKVKRLKRLLEVPLYRAVGILETLWQLCADCCDEGNVGKFSDEEIADYLEWDGKPQVLVAALTESGWLDADEVERLVVHDWMEHAPTYIRDRVRMRRAREQRASNNATGSRTVRTYVSSDANNCEQERTEANKPEFVQECHVSTKPNPTKPNPTNPNQTQPNQSKNTVPLTRRFVKPEMGELVAYCEQRGRLVDPQAFFDFYESKGWLIGKSPMKDWRACVRTWEKTARKSSARGVGSGQRFNPNE